MKQFELMVFAGALCLTACAEHPDLLGGGVELSDNQISFSTSTVNGWQGINSNSRAAVIVGENGPLKMESSLGHPLYLHSIEQAGTYIYNTKDELITRSGAPLPSDGNLLHVDNANAKTRGAKFTDTSLTNAFGVSAILTSNSTTSSYFQNLKATPSGGSWITTSEAKYWPIDGSLSFYAYHPYSTDSHGMLSEDAAVDVDKARTVHYVASANDVEHQPDLIIAKHENVTHGSTEAPNSVSLNFSHVLTAITFAVGSDMVPGTVKSIAIKGVKNTGDYDLATNTWKTSGNSVDFTISLGGGNGIKVTGKQDEALTTGAQTLMMIPQTFADDNSKVEIVFENKTGSHTLSASLKGTQWDAGSTIIYKISTSSLMPQLTLSQVTFPTNWSSQYTQGALKSDYVQGDKIGLYVVDQAGIVKEANVELTYNGNTWSFPHDKLLRLKPTNQYFTYYPYKPDGDNNLRGMPQQGSVLASTALASANNFFHSLEAAWIPSKDQSSYDKLNACDLQVAKAVINNTGSGINLVMEHGCGLADITLDYTANYQLSNDHNYTWHSSELVSNKFTGITPDKLADNHYVAIVKPAVQTSIHSSDTNTKYAWKNPLIFNPAIASIEKKTALPVNDKIHDYTLELGDIYYSDGACSHQSDALEVNKTPIGIVGYIGQNKWTEYQTGSGHGGHALVMCLLNTDSYRNGTAEGIYYSQGQYGDYGTIKVTTSDMLIHSYDKDYGSGFISTRLFLPYSNLAQKAKNCDILVAPKDKSTGWFLPTAGQFYAFYSQINGGVSTKSWIFFSELMGNSEQITKQIDKFLLKVGNGKYLPLGQAKVTALGCSTEYDANTTLNFETDWYISPKLGRAGFAGDGYWNGSIGHKNVPLYVRPFLAF